MSLSGLSENPLQSFHELAHDISLAEDFLIGTAARLREAAEKESAQTDNRHEGLMAGYVGDTRKLDQLRNSFHQGRYASVVKLSRGLKYPNRMTPSERKMVEIACKRSGILWRLTH